jgi:hypothetical protein
MKSKRVNGMTTRLWHIDTLLGNDRETSTYTTAVAK